MPALTLELEEDGFLDLTIGGISQRVDAYATQNKLFELNKQYADKPAEHFHAAVVTLLGELGFPPCSHRVADRFVVALGEHVTELKKKPGPGGESTAASPGSTASTPGS